MIAELAPGRYKMSLEPLVRPESKSKKVLHNRTGDISKYHGSQLRGAPLPVDSGAA